MGTAVRARYFCPNTIGVRRSLNRAWNFFIEAGPTAVSLKLVFRAVQGGSAAFADVGAFFPESVVFAGEGHFGAFVDDYLFFFRC